MERLIQQRELNYQRIVELKDKRSTSPGLCGHQGTVRVPSGHRLTVRESLLKDKTDEEIEEIVEDIQCTLPSIIILSYNSFSKLQFETFGSNVVVTFNTPKIENLGTNHLHIITHQSSKLIWVGF